MLGLQLGEALTSALTSALSSALTSALTSAQAKHLPTAPLHTGFLSQKVCDVIITFFNVTHMCVI